jgi:hypothetical protein
MALPTLTPTSATSATILTSSGTPGDVATACPIGVYTGSVEFLSGASAQVAYVYKRLGGDVLDIELTTANVYANYEEAVLEYSYLVNLHQSKNVLGSALGSATSSFDYKGEVSGSGTKAALKYPKYRLEYALRMGDTFSHEAGIGGSDPIYSASIDMVENQQDYDLQNLISSSAAAGGVPYAGVVGDNRIVVREVYYRTPQQMWRFYGYYGGLNVVGDYHSYGQYADQSTFQVIPAWQNKLQAVAYEDHLYTRTSHYSYEIIDNKLRLYPNPDDVSPNKWWVRFSIRSGPFSDDVNNQQDGVNNMNTLPFQNIAYESINSIGKQWIRRFGLALSKETLGQIRGKFGGAVPIPGETVTLNADALLSQAKEEQTVLRDELKTILAEMTYDKLIETDKTMAENQQTLISKVPLKIFVG